MLTSARMTEPGRHARYPLARRVLSGFRARTQSSWEATIRRAMNYTPAILSLFMLTACLFSVAAYYEWYAVPAVFSFALPLALLWFMFSWLLGSAQVLYGVARRNIHHGLSGLITVAHTGIYIEMLSRGWMITA